MKKEATIKNVSGRTVTLVVEIRRPENTYDLKVRIGRPTSSTVDGITKSLWLEDIPALMDLLNEAMAEAIPHYENLKKEQAIKSLVSEVDSLKAEIKSNPEDWRNKLVELEEL